MKTLINIIFAVVAVVLLLKACDRAAEVNSWPETKGNIISYDIEEYQDSDTYTDKNGKKRTEWEDEFRITFRYRFEVEGVEYIGRFKVDDLETDRDIRRKLKIYPNGKEVRVKYDPNNPNDSQTRI
ncbi:hypothetical protein GCM10007916_25410 [Psychromonas marina]|uniref:DUF3592 domain-containing protein n=1 Tax=Psychromonas marina TaxID=88364 RepID=A0ABQ6E277_9GAMM|nr:DUF3592 domain-containing protein [Psychromonas marina]GLS91472.1 hypothetical protein GCM10007916_25410 [Psychromonas marina]